MANEDKTEKDESIFKSKLFFNLREAVDEVKDSFQTGDAVDKAKSSSKLLGKSAFNLAVFAGKVGSEVVKRLPEQLEKHKK